MMFGLAGAATRPGRPLLPASDDADEDLDLLAAQGITADRRDGAPGVYVGDAKIAALAPSRLARRRISGSSVSSRTLA